MVGDAGEQVKRTDMTRDSKETMRHGERRKFTQTTRSLPARTTSAKIRLVFALISVITLLATMFVTGPFQARVAEAAEAGICKPSTGTIGDGNGPKTDSDDGVATWVGRDMYVGAPNGDATHYDSNTKPMQSYAVEAEGLTAIKGKLISNAIKGAKGDDSVSHANFNGHGFRFGTVGFGANLRPTTGSDVLVIGGESDVTLSDAEGNSVNALAWGNAARGNVRSDNLGPGHRISIAGGWSKAHEIDQNDNYDDLERGDDINYNWVNEGSVFNFDDRWNRPSGTSSEVRWNVNDPLSNVRLNTNDDSKTTSIKGQQENIENLSKVLKARPTTAQGVVSTAPEQNGFYRQNYGNANYRVTFNFGGEQSNTPKEGLITFTGNGTNTGQIDSATGAYKVTGGSVMQVFTLDASLLDNAGTNGISFRFDNIPEYASVVINVVGDRQITFNNGWRFWWNGAEISNYYTVFNQDNKQARNELYSHAASAIMWNFADVTSKVTVRGGQITNGQNGWVENTRADGKHYSQNVGGEGQVQITDDPVANMLGSVLVPNGSFETHVSTNGRVWVGKDYMMYNPTGLEELAYLNGFQSNAWNQPISASVIEQDQERHNFGWHGEISDACAVLEWSKVDSDGNALAGTEWAIYASKEAAMRHDTTAALVTVLDDGHDDWAIGTKGQGVGKFQVRRLNPNATYYLREISAPAGYAVNSNIYQINTGNGNQTENDIDQVVDGGFIKSSTTITATFDSQGNSATNDLLWTTDESTYGKRVMNMKLPSVEWEKVDSETGALLGGSEWRLYKKQVENGTTTYPVIKESITDAYGTMVYLDTKTAKWPADGGVTETPKIHYKIGNRGDWTVSEMTPYGNGIYGVYVPGRGQNVKFSFFLGTVSYKASEYRPDGSADNFSSGANVQYVTVRSKNQAVEPTQPTTSLQGPEYTDLDMRQGKFKLGGLTEGEYTLQETKAPEGYWLPNEGGSYYTFKVESQNGQYTISWIASSITVNGQTIQTTQAATTATNGVTVGKISNTPTKVTWEKVDSTDKKALAGSTWTLKRGESVLAEVSDCTSGNCETGIYKDQNNAAGKFMLKRLPAGTYKLQEATAPTGYQLSETVYKFTIPQTEPDTAEVKVTANAIGNDRKLGMVQFEKVAEGTSNRLSGSEWELTFKPQGSEEDKTKWKTIPITDCTEGNPTCSADSIDRDVVPGKFQIKSLTAPYGNNNLEWGTYELRETKAPDGYNLSDRVYTFTVDKDHLESIKLYVNGQEVSGNRIGNEPGVVLPVTGAEGRHLWPAIVGALFVLASFGCAVALRMRE